MPVKTTKATKSATPKSEAARDLKGAVKALTKKMEPRRAALRSRKAKLSALYSQSRASITDFIEKGNVSPTEKFLLENIRQLLRTVEGLALYCYQLDDRNSLTSVVAAQAFAARLETDAKVAAVGTKLGALAKKVSAKSAKKRNVKKGAAAAPDAGAPSSEIAASAKDAEAIAKITTILKSLTTPS